MMVVSIEHHPPQPQQHQQPKKYSKEYFEQTIANLQAALQSQLPQIDPKAQENFQTTCESFQDAKASRDTAQGLVNALKKTKSDQKLIDQAQEALDAAQKVLDLSSTICLAAAEPILNDLDNKLETSMDEVSLLQCTVLIQSTPEALAEFCAEDPNNGPLLDRHMSDTGFLRVVILNGGASHGKYHRAFYIYDQLVQCDESIVSGQAPSSSSDIRHRLALAVALELCQPHLHFHEKTYIVDPISRYWHYATAFDRGELDDAFETFSIWELRMVIDCDCKDEELQWGRTYLRNYRPDQVLLKEEQWRYCKSVRTDLNYKQPDHPFDTYAAMLSAGGECGPRAFFGRFICKAFGIPTWGVRQPGHAAMSRWTSDGWTICLGAAFKWSEWQDNRYGNNGSRTGPDFQEETEARKAVSEDTFYNNMILLECAAEAAADERLEQQVRPDKFWRSLSLMQRKKMSCSQQQVQAPSISNNLGSLVDDTINSLADELERKCPGVPRGLVKRNYDGSKKIVIPASSFSSPANPTENVIIIPSFLEGGDQLHVEHNATVEYTLPDFLPRGSYWLSCRYVSVHEMQVPLLLSTECSDDSVIALDSGKIDIEYTVGAWKTSAPVNVSLGGGDSTISFTREGNCHGLSIKDFSLYPC
jgi:hypothetical protein